MAATVASTASRRETRRDEDYEMLPARTAVERMARRATKPPTCVRSLGHPGRLKTMRACPSCSVISETEKDFCPECGTSYKRSSATAAANPVTAEKKGSPVQVLAVVGLAAYLLSWLLFAALFDAWGWGEALKHLSGYEALTMLDDSVKFALPNIFGALAGYVLLALVIVSSKKSS